MTVIDVVALPAEDFIEPEKYDYARLPHEIRVQAMTAEGTVVQGLRSAVQRVIEAGQALMWAKETLPHGEFLPWVEQACKLKPQYAQKLIKAAEWANAAHERHLDTVTDANTLFLLSADTTPEDVREWFMERCAAGDPPSRKEVQQRKQTATPGNRDRTVIQEALSVLKLSDQARQLAANAEHITTRQLLDDLGLDDIPKGKQHATNIATYCKNGNGWWKLPIVVKDQDQPQAPVEFSMSSTYGVMPIERASKILGLSVSTLRVYTSPKRVSEKGIYVCNGIEVKKDVGGMVRLTPVPN